MKISSIKDLEQVIKLCRRTGVEAIEIDGVKLSLGTPPQRITRKSSESQDNSLDSAPEYSDEQLLMWSSNG